MIEIAPRLFIGSALSLAKADNGINGIADDWFVVSAAKEPFHREAIGYTGRALDKGHPEYLMARRPNRLILNLVDVPDPAYIREEIVSEAMRSIDEALADDKKVLVHCNQGQSRAPTLGLLWLRKSSPDYADLDFDEGVAKFRETYPDYAPAGGMLGYARAHWG